jgi:hypothetical protein
MSLLLYQSGLSQDWVALFLFKGDRVSLVKRLFKSLSDLATLFPRRI